MQNRAVTARVADFVRALTDKGAEVVEISIPELERARVAHLVTLCAERSAFVGALLGRRAGKRLTCPSRVLMRVSKSLTAGVSRVEYAFGCIRMSNSKMNKDNLIPIFTIYFGL